MAVLSGLAHGSNPDQREVLDAVLAAYDTVGRERAALYHDLMTGGLPEAALKYLEERMALTGTYQYKSEFARTYFSQGKAAGEASGMARGEVVGEIRALLRVLAGRGIAVSGDARERITRCTDVQQLETWLERAAVAASVHDLFR